MKRYKKILACVSAATVIFSGSMAAAYQTSNSKEDNNTISKTFASSTINDSDIVTEGANTDEVKGEDNNININDENTTKDEENADIKTEDGQSIQEVENNISENTPVPDTKTNNISVPEVKKDENYDLTNNSSYDDLINNYDKYVHKAKVRFSGTIIKSGSNKAALIAINGDTSKCIYYPGHYNEEGQSVTVTGIFEGTHPDLAIINNKPVNQKVLDINFE